jgi:transcriptional regulator with XRE-family HTH domain
LTYRSTIDKTFGRRIRTLRLRQGLTIKNTALQAATTEQTFMSWEAGRTQPLLPKAGPIASALGVPVGALFNEHVAAEVVVSPETVERIRREGREACREVAKRLADQLEPVIWAHATTPAPDTRPGARPKPRRTKAERLAYLNARAKRPKRSIE